LLPKKVIELWKHFKGVKLLISLDAVGELNSYIRYLSQWDQVDKNLRYIDENHEELNIKECMISTTVQALNILHLPELYDYLSQFNFVVKAPNLVNLTFPRYFQTTVLPKPLKKMAQLRLSSKAEEVRENLEPHYHYLADNISAILNFMNSSDHYESELFETFKKFQKDFDNKKKLNLLDHCPEFKQFI
jgi:MoaA/NifB/PqqE/SkfB family radical SAM enzyme